MSDRWVTEPRFMPRRCFLQRSADPAIGPYFEFNRPVGELDAHGRPTGRPEQIYLSRKAITEIMRSPGSPFEDPAQEADRLRMMLDAVEHDLIMARGELEEAKLELDDLRAQEPENGRVDPDELVRRIMEGMDERDALKNAERMARARAGKKKAQGFS